jgi:hypothetical protein
MYIHKYTCLYITLLPGLGVDFDITEKEGPKVIQYIFL